MQKIKIILSAVSAALLFVLGILAGHSGRHNSDGITDAIDREGEFQGRITGAQDGEREHQAGITDLESRVDEQGKRIDEAQDRIRDTDSLVDRLKKRNGLD